MHGQKNITFRYIVFATYSMEQSPS
jgi:hypothetical protein